jgi:formylglycine-generating enzyme required for sulfatase activity
MTWIPGGTFLMGSADFYPEERPVHQVTVDGFWMDRDPVTVTEFRRFVTATGYLTVAERPLAAADYPDADPDRWFAVAVLALNAIDMMFFVPAYPFWALTIIAVDVVALYGLCAYGSRQNIEAA